MSLKKSQPVKKIEAPAEEIIQEKPKAKEYKALRNFFFNGKNWAKDEVIPFQEKDIELLLSKGIIQ